MAGDAKVTIEVVRLITKLKADGFEFVTLE